MPPDFTQIPRLHIADIDLPREVAKLYDLAYNLWWSWSPRARALFNQIDGRTWSLYRNPVQLLINFDRTHWQAKLEDESFVSAYRQVTQTFDRYLAETADTWFARRFPEARGTIAYFCMEYGIHQALAIYSGGLGVLAGDHLKSASDLGLPLVGVGLLYRNGYFRQNIDADGRQQHIYPDYDFSRLPIRPAAGPTGRGVFVTVPFPDREIRVQVWVAQVGRVPLVLLDTDVPQNDSADRPITSTLYTPGREMRLAQELVLGIGGVRALAALGIEPAVWHMNEGHSAFLQFERLRLALEGGASDLDTALAALRRRSVFTTHTPLPAGNEVFDPPFVRKYFDRWWNGLGVPVERWTGLGNNNHGEPNQAFNMTALAVRTSARVNGVSKINATVSEKMWRHLLPESLPAAERMRAVTNGVHPSTWVGVELQEMFARWFGEKWAQVLASETGRVAILEGPDDELWHAHLEQKRRLARFLRARLRNQFARHGLSPDELRTVEQMFDPEVLTVGFARRFATYKRANLLFSDLHRLRQLVSNPQRPVQILLAGKAHPADKAGQELIAAPLPAHPVRQAQGPGLLRRGLRHAGRPHAGAGRRRLAEHAAAPARGLGHLRHEGGDERRAQLLDRRRLVARGLRRPERLGDRGQGGRGRRRRARPRGRARALPPARGADRAHLLRSRREADPAPVGRDDEGVDRDHHPEVLERSHGPRIRRVGLPAAHGLAAAGGRPQGEHHVPDPPSRSRAHAPRRTVRGAAARRRARLRPGLPARLRHRLPARRPLRGRGPVADGRARRRRRS